MIEVGFDYDEPFFAWYDLAHQACLKAGLAQPHHAPTDWDPSVHYGCTLQEWYDVLDQEILHGDMYSQPFKPGVVDAVKRLYNSGYGVHIITSRGNFGPHKDRIRDLTISQLVREGMPYDSLHFTPDKVDIAVELGLDYFIDDLPKHYEALDAAGVNVYMLNERWNKPWDDGKRRVNSTEEYIDMILANHGDLSKMSTAQRAYVRGEVISR